MPPPTLTLTDAELATLRADLAEGRSDAAADGLDRLLAAAGVTAPAPTPEPVPGSPRKPGRARRPWPPAKPRGFEFTPHRDGWAKWYKGQSRVITLKSLDRAAVRAAWDDRRATIDAAMAAGARPLPGAITVRGAIGLFYEYLDHRVRTGTPEPLALATQADYHRTTVAFARAVGPELRLAEVGPAQFRAYGDTLAGCSPTTLTRAVAYVQAFVRWCVDEGHLAEEPEYGRYFRKPRQQERRDVRLGQAKRYTPGQLRLLWFHATFEEKLWIALGLSGAFDNADLANLTHDVLNREQGTVDYRRRKRGRTMRVVPLPPMVWDLLDSYRRPPPADPAHGDRVLLTPTGLPLQRYKAAASGRSSPIDYVAMCWVRLMVRAGLRPAYPRLHRMANPPRERRTRQRGGAAGQGFRAIRTTFPNLAPRGYREQVELIMGHAHGTVLLENYVEEHGVEALRECVDGVWRAAFGTDPAASDLTRPPAAEGAAVPQRPVGRPSGSGSRTGARDVKITSPCAPGPARGPAPAPGPARSAPGR